MDYSIEYGHIYSGQLFTENNALKDNIGFTKMILSQIKSRGFSYSTVVLVDDYTLDADLTIDKNFLSEYFRKLGLPPDFIFFESAFSEFAEEIIESLPPKFLHKKNQKLFLTNKGDELYFFEIPPRNRRHKAIFMKKINKIPLDKSDSSKNLKIAVQDRNQSLRDTLLYVESANNRKYSCPLLATAWYLARLKIEPFNKVISKHCNDDRIFAKHLINILPVEYIRVESSVRDILYYSKNKNIRQAKNLIRYFFH